MTTLVGLVGWRGIVGSVLMDRMTAERDFDLIEPLFFSTSNAGGAAPAQAKNETKLQDAFDIAQLKRCEIIITAQGGDYTTEVIPQLRAAGWNGHWIDAASTLRMKDDAVIILDPVNMPVIQNALAKGGNNWIGGNCSVSCSRNTARSTPRSRPCSTTRRAPSWRSTARSSPSSAPLPAKKPPTSAY